LTDCDGSLGPLSPAKDKEGRGASVVVVGAGGLGVAAVAELAARAVERLTIFDDDRVEVSNLHRQLLHGATDIGRPKAEVAAEKARRLAPQMDVDARVERLHRGNVVDALAGHDVVIDASDNATTKFLVNDVCVLRRVPLVHAGVVGLTGQLMTILPGETACLRCVFPDAPSDDETASCHAAGILGPLAALVGSLQAREAVKILTGEGRLIADRLMTIDCRSLRIREVPLRRSPTCPLCSKPVSDTVSPEVREESP